MNWYEYRISGGQSIKGEKIQGRRTIQEYEFIGISKLINQGAKTEFAVFQGYELDGSPDEIFVRGDDIQALYLGFEDYSVDWLIENKLVVESAPGRIFGKSDGCGHVALRIAVD